MLEAQIRSVEIKDVKSEDFIRFCKFMYRGDYITPPYNISEGRVEEPNSKKSVDTVSLSQEPGDPSAPMPPVSREPTTVAVTNPYADPIIVNIESIVGEPSAEPDDIWASWGTSTKDRKKGKKKNFFYAKPSIPEKKTGILRESFGAKCFCPNGFSRKPILSEYDSLPIFPPTKISPTFSWLMPAFILLSRSILSSL